MEVDLTFKRMTYSQVKMKYFPKKVSQKYNYFSKTAINTVTK